MNRMECWAVWCYWELRDGVRREYVEAVCATREQAIEEAARRLRNEAADECLPHHERLRLFVKPVAVYGLVPG